MIEEQVDTKTRLLDAAEKLFGQNGFDATSLRDITAGAQVNLAAVNYHFQSKESLIDAVIERRMEPVNQKRIQMLDAVGPAPTVEQIIEPFLAPILDQEIWQAGPLIGRVFSNPDQFLERFFKKRLAAVAQRFRDAISQALPALPPEEVLWRLHFMAGSMSHVLVFSQVLPAMTGGLCNPQDRSALMTRLVTFLAAGFRAPAPRVEKN
jgi:AcrR family transcriptional regulator